MVTSSFKLVVPGGVRKISVQDVVQEKRTVSEPDGYQNGFNAGYRAGMLKAELEATKQREEQEGTFRRMVDQLDRVYTEFSQSLRDHLPQLVLASVSRVMMKHHFSDEEIVSEIESLVRELTLAKSIHIECSEEDLNMLQQKLASSGGLASAQIEWKNNPTLLKGEFILQSDLGEFDGRKMARLSRVKSALGLNI
jgi:flagellar biosynthesis/type III secretory pathway protein FliH